MKRVWGPLLRRALERIGRAPSRREARLVASHLGSGGRLPVVIQPPALPVRPGETWPDYRDRSRASLDPLQRRLGPLCRPLLAAHALQARLAPDELDLVRNAEWIELDPVVQVVTLDDAADDVGLPLLRQRRPGLDGTGVRVAVLDSGADADHPHLTVARSVATCDEPVSRPGAHGTHIAGTIASRDRIYRGVAPGVTLLNVKVLRADGTGRHTWITKGVDEALDEEAHVISISIALNQLPPWSEGGHGWTCRKGRCPLCTAVDNASRLGRAVVVTAAGNEHERAEELRRWGQGDKFDTELGCPGQAREAITVGALTKRTHLPAPFSSRGPTADGRKKPDLAAPGVNITSTVPAPRGPDGKPKAKPPRSVLFGRRSGTSMAAPIVAGAAALLVQERLDREKPVRARDIRRRLLSKAVTAGQYPAHVAGAGRLDLSVLVSR